MSSVVQDLQQVWYHGLACERHHGHRASDQHQVRAWLVHRRDAATHTLRMGHLVRSADPLLRRLLWLHQEGQLHRGHRRTDGRADTHQVCAQDLGFWQAGLQGIVEQVSWRSPFRRSLPVVA